MAKLNLAKIINHGKINYEAKLNLVKLTMGKLTLDELMLVKLIIAKLN